MRHGLSLFGLNLACINIALRLAHRCCDVRGHLMLHAVNIIQRLKKVYPIVAKFYIPELRKVNDIAARERKILGITLPAPTQQPTDAGFSADDITNGG